MSDCPSCGRYVGPHEACPYCGARLTGRTSIRVVKIAAIVLATVGLAVLWLAATHAEVPRIAIGQARATMNMAYVRVEGRCTRTPTYDPDGDYLSFWIADETGELRVAAYRAETRQLIEQDRVPALGDWVEVAGTLRVREDFLSLTLNVPEQLEIARPEPEERAIGAIGPEDRYRRVRVRGQVSRIYEPYEGLTLITVRDETGSIPVAVGEDLVALSGITPTLSAGQSVELEAAVSLYEETPQLVPASTADIVPLEDQVPVAAERFIGELTEADVGERVTVRGRVTEVTPFSKGVKVALDDGSGTVTLLLWQDVYDALPDQTALGVGAEVRVQGEVSLYGGELEIIAESAERVSVVSAASEPAESAPSIGEITAADVGQTVTLRGALGERETFSRGVKFPLDDGTGTITLLLWQDVYDALPNVDELAPGAQVEVRGEIEEYQGELEIIPQADGVSVVE